MYIVQSIDFQPKGNTILKDVKLQVKPGKFTALLGPNGAGKSTLLKIMSGRLTPHRGIVLLDEKPIQDYKRDDLAMRRAVLPQKTSLSFPYTVLEVVMMGCIAHKSRKAVQQKIAQEKLDAVGFQYDINRNYLELSGGEQQRVQLARVLAQINSPSPATKYLLLDEPTASLDIAKEQQFMQIIQELCKAGIGVLAILHDLNVAIQYADELVLMKGGEVIKAGTVKEVVNHHTIESVYECPVRLIPTAHKEKPIVMPITNQEFKQDQIHLFTATH